MSADNWTYCPKCRENARIAAATARDKAEKDYGKVPAGEYLELIFAANNPQKLTETLREDFSIGVYGEVFKVHYQAFCSVCKFRFEYKEERPAIAAAPTTAPVTFRGYP